MRVFLVKTRSGHLVPATDEDRVKLRAMKPGDVLPVRIRKPRNGDHWRKFMALVTFVRRNHPRHFLDVDNEALIGALKIKAGHYKHRILAETGEVVYEPLSLSFDEIDEGDFVVIGQKMKEVLLEQYFPDLVSGDVDERDAWIHWIEDGRRFVHD